MEPLKARATWLPVPLLSTSLAIPGEPPPGRRAAATR